jgi:hypothetical protein
MNINLELHIEELILHHVPPHQQDLIGAAIEQELTRLFSEQGVPPTLAKGGQMGQIDGGAFNVAPNATADAIGSQVAQAIYGGIS